MTAAYVARALIAKHGRHMAYAKAARRWMVHTFVFMTHTPRRPHHTPFWEEVLDFITEVPQNRAPVEWAGV